MQKSMSLEYEPASEPLHIYVPPFSRRCLRLFARTTFVSPGAEKLTFFTTNPACQLENSWSTRVRQRYRGTSLIRNRAPLGPYSRTKPRDLW